MSQLNIQMNPSFEEALAKFMLVRGIRTKSEAVRTAIFEGLERAASPGLDFSKLLGAAGPAENPHPRFSHHGDVWL